MPLTRNFDNLPSARRSILHAIRFGQEVDLYEGLDRILQHLTNAADRDHPKERGYYCAPQGHVTARGTVKRRDQDQLHDPDYLPSPSPSAGPGAVEPEETEEVADEDLENRDVVDDEEDEQGEGDGNEDPELIAAAESRLGGKKLSSWLPKGGPRNVDVSLAGSNASASALDRSFGTNSSTEVPYKVFRLPDFRLSHAWLRDGEEILRYIGGVVEVKLCTEKTSTSSNMSYRELIDHTIDNMAPQVIEAVQVAFAEKLDQNEIVAIPVVNAFCRFVYFVRGTVPVLDPALANQGKGFVDPQGFKGSLLYAKYARKTTRTIQMMSGGGDFLDSGKPGDGDKAVKEGQAEGKGLKFGQAFISHWNNFILWTRDENLFPLPVED